MYPANIFLVATFASSVALAAPSQIEVIGIVPGVSTEAQIIAAGYSNWSGDPILTIGGHQLACSITTIEDKVSKLICGMGQGSDGSSNVQVHNDLVKGFSKKFGPPYLNFNNPMTTRMGVKYLNNVVEWKDKKGNTLSLHKYAGSVDKGVFIMTSAAQNKIEAADNSAKEANRKF